MGWIEAVICLSFWILYWFNFQTALYWQVDHFTRYGLKEVQIEMEDGSVTRPPLRPFHEVKLIVYSLNKV
jgi:hypothetical protein